MDVIFSELTVIIEVVKGKYSIVGCLGCLCNRVTNILVLKAMAVILEERLNRNVVDTVKNQVLRKFSKVIGKCAYEN